MVAYPGLLQLLPLLEGTWKNITMYFIAGLPKLEGKDTIMVMVDRFSKYRHFIAMSHPFTAQEVAQVFIYHFYKFHRLPTTTVTDRDKVFTSLFRRELFKTLGVKLFISSVYHP